MGGRCSNIELLKVIGILLIILSHSMPDGNPEFQKGAINIYSATKDIQLTIAFFIKNLGQIGNHIFIISSAWFLLESKAIKKSKVAGIVGDCFTISTGMLVSFLLLGYRFNSDYIKLHFFPIKNNNYWFIDCYILLYILHPVLNKAIKSMDKKALLRFNVVFFILYNCIGFINECTLFYFSNFIGFIGIYFFVAYVKMYLHSFFSIKKNKRRLLIIGIMCWVGFTLANIVLRTGSFSFVTNKIGWMSNFMAPHYYIIGIALFELFVDLEIHSRVINYLSSLSMLIYMIHTHKIMREYVRFDIFGYIQEKYSFDWILLWLLVFFVFNVVSATLLAVFYDKVFKKYVHFIFEKLTDGVLIIYRPIEKWLTKI